MKKTRRIRIPASWRRPWIGVAVLAIVAALAIAGCGGSSSSGSSSTSGGSGSEESGASSSTEAPAQGPGHFEISEEARTCLKEHGLEPPAGGKPPAGEGGPPAGGFGGAGGKGAELKEAFEACGVEGPMGKGAPGGAPTNSAAFRTSVKEYVTCVRENGYEMPEPNLSGEGPIFNKSEVNQEDPKFKAASEKCESILHSAGGGSTEGSSTES
jgi:hypothetical protein